MGSSVEWRAGGPKSTTARVGRKQRSKTFRSQKKYWKKRLHPRLDLGARTRTSKSLYVKTFKEIRKFVYIPRFSRILKFTEPKNSHELAPFGRPARICVVTCLRILRTSASGTVSANHRWRSGNQRNCKRQKLTGQFNYGYRTDIRNRLLHIGFLFLRFFWIYPQAFSFRPSLADAN